MSILTDTYQRVSEQLHGILAFWIQVKNIAQGEPLPKRDIVDTKTHASCAARLNKDKQSPFPTT